MKRQIPKGFVILFIVIMGLCAGAFAQQNVSVSGIIEAEAPLPEETRVGVHVVDLNGATLREVASAGTVAGTFDVTTTAPPPEVLEPFRGGAVPLPGLQNEYRVSPEGVNYARALTKVYADSNNNEAFDGIGIDAGFIGIASIAEPKGFFVLLYVDRDATLSGRGTDLELKEGWNVFTARFPAEADALYAVGDSLDDAVLSVFP